MAKTVRAAPRRRSHAPRHGEGSGIAGAFLRIAVKPAAIGSAAFLVMVGSVWSNALVGQSGKHPNPLVATRGANLPNLLENAEGTIEAPGMPVPLVREVQVELARTGHYVGEIDGRPGPETEGAIKAFEREHGLQAEGVATPALLSRLRDPAPAAEDVSGGGGEAVASLDERMGRITPPIPDDTTDLPEMSSEPPAPAPVTAPAGRSEGDLVRRIQTGLASAQVAELVADGIIGEQTRAAIRTFEALEGMEVTGEASPRILERLIEIGALPSQGG